MSEIKLEAGQWYRTRGGDIVHCVWEKPAFTKYPFVVGTSRGDVYSTTACGRYFSDGQEHRNDIIEHLPGCTGFDWVPEPKLQLREGAWYEREDGEIVGPCRPNGSAYRPWTVGSCFYRNDGTNTADDQRLVREVDPPQPKYRAFANLKEFLPHRDRFVCVNNPNDKYLELYRVNVFNDHTFWLHSSTGYLYARGLHEYCFADVDANGELVFSPFGVLDQ